MGLQAAIDAPRYRILEGDELAFEETGTYQLLLPYMQDPAELKRFYDETVRPLVSYDEQYETDLLGTLATFLDCDANVNATAARLEQAARKAYSP